MREIAFNLPCERVRGISIPQNNTFFILGYDEVYKATIRKKVRTKRTHFDSNEDLAMVDSFKELSFTNRDPNAPIVSNNNNRISYNFDPADDSVEVICNISGEIRKIDFPTFSGDWFCATFSEDGKYMVLAEPYKIAVYDVHGDLKWRHPKNKSERNLMSKLFAFIRPIIPK